MGTARTERPRSASADSGSASACSRVVRYAAPATAVAPSVPTVAVPRAGAVPPTSTATRPHMGAHASVADPAARGRHCGASLDLRASVAVMAVLNASPPSSTLRVNPRWAPNQWVQPPRCRANHPEAPSAPRECPTSASQPGSHAAPPHGNRHCGDPGLRRLTEAGRSISPWKPACRGPRAGTRPWPPESSTAQGPP